MKQFVADDFHYFAANYSTWRVNTDLEELIAEMKAENLAFDVYLVPLPITAHYKIHRYAPVVDDTVMIVCYIRSDQ